MMDDKDSIWIPNVTQQRLESEVSKLIEVRNACLAARANAHAAAVDTDTLDNYNKYISARDRCISLAESISDDFYRDTAFHLIYDLCKRAGDEANAQITFGRITSDMIRGKIVDGRPAIFD